MAHHPEAPVPIDKIIEIFGTPSRIRVLNYLLRHPLGATRKKISEETQVPSSTVGVHLILLRELGVVRAEIAAPGTARGPSYNYVVVKDSYDKLRSIYSSYLKGETGG